MKIFFGLFFIGLSFFINAQGNLQFNQVKLVSSVETVPAGKVWKIENILPGVRPTTTSWGNSTLDFIININNQTVYYLSSESKGSLFGNGQTGISSISVGIGNAPIWLPAGSILSAGTNVLSVNVLEFNLVP
jgi:hypothetical protein